jgi:4-amino-4-deoxy-L-arabinose transferase-like glycosyltransferase
MRKIWFILLIITLLSFFVRIYEINSVPPGLTWDEAALGYNAYSILKTGKDEYGQRLPLVLKSFGDYKPALYVYLAIPFIALFGLTEFAVRAPSILLGSLIPLLSFFLIRELTGKDKNALGLILAGLLSISPWAVHFSRGAWEANVAFFGILLAILCLLKSTKDKKLFFFLSAILFCLSILTYQSSKIFSLAFFFGIIFIKRDFFLRKQNLKLTGILSLLLVGVFLFSVSSSEVRSRLAYLNQLSYSRKVAEIAQIKKEENNFTELNYNIFHSESFEYIKTVTSRYINYFSPKFLFSQGASDGRQGVLDYGVLHLFEIIFLILGVIYFVRSPNSDQKKILILLLLVAPIPAAASRDVISSVRTLPLVFPLEFLTAIGIYYASSFVRAYKFSVFLLPFLVLAILYNVFYYFDRLYIHTKIDSSEYFLGGYKPAVQAVIENNKPYDQIYFSTEYKEPYIYYLFYSKYDPEKFQKQAKLVINNPPDVGEVERLDNINFVKVDWHKLRYTPNLLLIGSEIELPKSEIENSNQARIIKTIYSPQAEKNVIFNIVETF